MKKNLIITSLASVLGIMSIVSIISMKNFTNPTNTKFSKGNVNYSQQNNSTGKNKEDSIDYSNYSESELFNNGLMQDVVGETYEESLQREKELSDKYNIN